MGPQGPLVTSRGQLLKDPKCPGQEFDIYPAHQRDKDEGFFVCFVFFKDEILSRGVMFSMCTSEMGAPGNFATLGVPGRPQKIFAIFCHQRVRKALNFMYHEAVTCPLCTIPIHRHTHVHAHLNPLRGPGRLSSPFLGCMANIGHQRAPPASQQRESPEWA